MTFVQEHTHTEFGFGDTTVRFVVTDDYDLLFATDAEIATAESRAVTDFKVDVFNLGSIKKDLELEGYSYAVDEFTFKVNAGSAFTVADIRALNFCYHAIDANKVRMCSVFFIKEGEAPGISTMQFIGRLTSDTKQSDLDWKGHLPWATDIESVSEYEFSALSFDVSILENCKLTKQIENSEGVDVPALYSRFFPAEIETMFLSRRTFNMNADDNVFLFPTATLYNVLQLILTKSSAMIDELIGKVLTLQLAEQDLNLTVRNTVYEVNQGESTSSIPARWGLVDEQYPGTQLLDLGLYSDGHADYEKNPFIGLELFNPDYISIYPFKEDSYKYSFKGLDNVGELIFECARCFGCYPIFETVDTSTIELRFVSLKALSDGDQIYIIGAKDSNVNYTINSDSQELRYYSTVNNQAWEGDSDSGRNVPHDGPSDTYRTYKEKIADEKDRNIEYKRLLLSISQPVHQSSQNSWQSMVPLNTFMSATTTEEYDVTPYYSQYFRRLSNALYRKMPIEALDQAGWMGAGFKPLRPCSNIIANIDGSNREYKKLSDYITALAGRSREFYKTERDLTLPFWSGFSPNSDGSGSGIGNLKLGSKIILTEQFQEWDGTEWTAQNRSTNTYTVIGIEINCSEPETKIKLQSTDRFSTVNTWDTKGGTDLPNSGENNGDLFGDKVSDPSLVRVGLFSGVIKEGEVVMLQDDGYWHKCQNLTANVKYAKGIALNSGLHNDEGYIATGGEVELNVYEFDLAKPVYCRYVDTPTHNVSQSLLLTASVNEDTILKVGKPLSAKRLSISFEEWVI